MGPNEVLDKGLILDDPTPLFHVVRLTGVDHGTVVDAAGEDWFGIAQEGADALDVARQRVTRVRPMGISRGVAGTALTTFVGATTTRTRVAAAADGRLVAATTGQYVVGILLTGGDENDWVNVQLTPGLVAP